MHLESLTGRVHTWGPFHLVGINWYLTKRYQGHHGHTIQGCLVLSSQALPVVVWGKPLSSASCCHACWTEQEAEVTGQTD